MTSVLLFNANNVFYDRLGQILSSGTIQTFAGGTQTPLATYSDEDLTTPNSTTLTLDSSGFLPVNVYTDQSVPYRLICKTSSGTIVFAEDQSFQESFSVNPLGSIISLTNNAVTIMSGTGSPQSVVTAIVGSMYLRVDGGANTTLYIKESGTGNTGWVAK